MHSTLSATYDAATMAHVDPLDISDPPQLCNECGRGMDVDFAGPEGMTLVLLCPVHGPQGLLDPFGR